MEPLALKDPSSLTQVFRGFGGLGFEALCIRLTGLVSNQGEKV